MMTYDAHESFVAVKVVLNGCFQVDGIATKVAVGISRTQLLLHASPLRLFPSSHSSLPSSFPSPQTIGVEETVIVVCACV